MSIRTHALDDLLLGQTIDQYARYFLQQVRPERLAILKQLGLARYADFLALMPLTAANVGCVERFFSAPSRVKFPDLRGVDLAGLRLDGANAIRGNLTGANLRGCSLRNADLLFARLTGADLSHADLTGATLNETDWTGAIVAGCQLGGSTGLTAKQQQMLVSKGAILG